MRRPGHRSRSLTATIKGDAGVKGKLTTLTVPMVRCRWPNRSPLYYYVDDKAAGDTNGQGVGDVWFIAKP